MFLSVWSNLIFLSLVNPIFSWDTVQLEVFDVVEEIQQNFYDLLGVSQEADISEIKSAYRKLSLILHPDKNPAEDAAVKFRRLVAVYDILRHPEKRRYYNEVLVHGLPDWRSPVYYYRKAKRVTLIELSLFLFIIISLGQYIIAWASYMEKKYTLQSNKRGKQKKVTVEDDIPKPSVKQTLPVQIPLLLWTLALSLPSIVLSVFLKINRKIQDMHEKKIDDEPEEPLKVTKPQTQKRKYIQELPDFTGIDTFVPDVSPNTSTTLGNAKKSVKTGPWSEEEMSEFAKLIKKFPGGTPGRWDLIADALNRSVDDVTKVMKLLRENSYKATLTSNSEKQLMEKIKPQLPTNENIWTQQQQQALEQALQKYPKTIADRWDRIAEVVPNKTKEECILRYKYLVEMVKKQKKQNDK